MNHDYYDPDFVGHCQHNMGTPGISPGLVQDRCELPLEAHLPRRRPENYDEIEAVIDLVWGDHPELQTVGDIRKACDERIKEMRGGGAEPVGRCQQCGNLNDLPLNTRFCSRPGCMTSAAAGVPPTDWQNHGTLGPKGIER